MPKPKISEPEVSEGLNVVTIREFTRNIYKYIKAKANIVVTNKGINAFEVMFCRDNEPLKTGNVVTKEDNVVTISKPKAEILKELRQQTEEILQPLVADEPKHNCAVCKKLFRRTREAVEEIEILSNDAYGKEWVCQEHRAKLVMV